jgi:hypothetical protein
MRKRYRDRSKLIGLACHLGASGEQDHLRVPFLQCSDELVEPRTVPQVDGDPHHIGGNTGSGLAGIIREVTVGQVGRDSCLAERFLDTERPQGKAEISPFITTGYQFDRHGNTVAFSCSMGKQYGTVGT